MRIVDSSFEDIRIFAIQEAYVCSFNQIYFVKTKKSSVLAKNKLLVQSRDDIPVNRDDLCYQNRY